MRVRTRILPMVIPQVGREHVERCRSSLLRCLEAPVTSGLKRISLASFAMRGDGVEFRAAGFNGYLTEPVRSSESSALVNRLLEGELL